MRKYGTWNQRKINLSLASCQIYMVFLTLTPLSIGNWSYLEVGTHEYFGQVIKTTPIRTTSGFCYKIENKATKFQYETSFLFNVMDIIGQKNQIDKIEKINLYVAADNTWQGVTYGSWANTKNPLKVVGEYQDFSFNINFVQIEATEWTYIKGNDNYSQCLEDQEPISESCKSIFHPKSFTFEKR